MKHVLWIFVVLITSAAYAQQVHFESPSSPAFTILDFEPTSVLRPTSPSELKTNFLTAFDENGKLKPNFGIEFSPYWLKSNPTLTYEKYSDPGTLQSIMQTLSISLATREDTALNKTVMGLGMKFQFVPGKLVVTNPETKKALQNKLDIVAITAGLRSFVKNDIMSSREEILDSLVSYIESLYGEEVSKSYGERFDELSNNFADDKNGNVKLLEEIIEEYNDEAVSIDVSRERIGLIIELAGAAKFYSDENDAHVSRWGGWLTIGNRSAKNSDFLFTLRYLRTTSDTVQSNLDAGISYVKDFDNCNFSIEGVVRNSESEYSDLNQAGDKIIRLERDFTYRIAATIQYRVNDYINVNFSIGKNYKQPFTTEGSFFSVAGVSLNMFREVEVKGAK